MNALFVAASLLIALVATRAEAYDPPPIRGHVNDPTSVLDAGQQARLEAQLDQFRRETGAAIVVFIPATLGGESIEAVAYATFNTWHLGRRYVDDGVLLVIAPGERRVRIETGLGLKAILSDEACARILRASVTPRLRAGDVYGAVHEGTRAVEAVLRPAVRDR